MKIKEGKQSYISQILNPDKQSEFIVVVLFRSHSLTYLAGIRGELGGVGTVWCWRLFWHKIWRGRLYPFLLRTPTPGKPPQIFSDPATFAGQPRFVFISLTHFRVSHLLLTIIKKNKTRFPCWREMEVKITLFKLKATLFSTFRVAFTGQRLSVWLIFFVASDI